MNGSTVTESFPRRQHKAPMIGVLHLDMENFRRPSIKRLLVSELDTQNASVGKLDARAKAFRSDHANLYGGKAVCRRRWLEEKMDPIVNHWRLHSPVV